MTQAKGTFDVKLTPMPADVGDELSFTRFTIDKQFHGDLDGTSKGQMVAAGTEIKNSAGYVAEERVTGTLHGRHGSFTLQHSATMTRGVGELSVTVVPDSGTAELLGLTGKLNIIIEGGAHRYEFEYNVASPA
jgi:hypothetical protein